jgi:hypothetical protein
LPGEALVSIVEPAALTSEEYVREGGKLFICMEASRGKVSATRSV